MKESLLKKNQSNRYFSSKYFITDIHQNKSRPRKTLEVYFNWEENDTNVPKNQTMLLVSATQGEKTDAQVKWFESVKFSFQHNSRQ